MTQPCSRCGFSNAPTSKFCGQCGQPLAQRCVACGAELVPGVRFCGQCGALQTTPAPAPAAPATEPLPRAGGEVFSGTGVLRGHTARVISIAASPDGRYALSGDEKGGLHLWDLVTGQSRFRLPGHKDEIPAVAFSPDGRYALSTGGFLDPAIRIWDVGNGRQIVRLEGHTGAVPAALFSPDSRLVLSGGEDKTVRLWEVKCGFELVRLVGHAKPVLTVGFAPDGRQGLSAANDMTFRIWDLEGDREVRRAWMDAAYENLVLDCAFSGDGLLALSTDPEGVQVWDLAAGSKLRTLAGHSGNIFAVAFSPDGRRALSCSGTDYYDDKLRQELGGVDNTVRLWDVGSGQELARLEGHERNVNCVAFLPDGRHAVSGSSDSLVRLWSLPA
jgi:WD40 repeat protein